MQLPPPLVLSSAAYAGQPHQPYNQADRWAAEIGSGSTFQSG
jgi:hypothetical protein